MLTSLIEFFKPGEVVADGFHDFAAYPPYRVYNNADPDSSGDIRRL